MTRDRVPSPKQYIGKQLQKMFTNNVWYTDTIDTYDDDKQWWLVTYEDGDAEVLQKYCGSLSITITGSMMILFMINSTSQWLICANTLERILFANWAWRDLSQLRSCALGIAKEGNLGMDTKGL